MRRFSFRSAAELLPFVAAPAALVGGLQDHAPAPARTRDWLHGRIDGRLIGCSVTVLDAR